jgi:beta-lysine 5,6-aminomutase beta subunit
MKAPKVNPRRIKPYGVRLDDGIIQLSFTLPIPCDGKAPKAALLLAEKMGLTDPEVVHQLELKEGFTFFILYGKSSHSIDLTRIPFEENGFRVMSQVEVEKFIQEEIRREVIIVGATTGTDAHTLGLDSILNIKGFEGKPGLEGYHGMTVYNLGGQVSNQKLVKKAVEVQADAVLVSQIVTEQDLHIGNLHELTGLLRAAKIRQKTILICGGPRISQELATELGYDMSFSKATFPNQVASYIVSELKRRLG